MSSSVSIRLMTLADVPLGMKLKAAVRWNQTEADWHRFLRLQPEGCFVAEVAGQGAGTLAAFAFESIGWIAMVLVDLSFQRQGIGTALMKQGLSFLEAQSVKTVRLDATAQGRPVYEKLGFVVEYELSRYEGILPQATAAAPALGDKASLKEIAKLDQRVTATSRKRLLEALMVEKGANTRITGNSGYLMDRPGTRATQIGPAVALDETSGLALLQDAGQRLAGQSVFIDIPIQNQPAIAWAERIGLKVQRPFLRMRCGPAVADVPGQIWASSGPEKG